MARKKMLWGVHKNANCGRRRCPRAQEESIHEVVVGVHASKPKAVLAVTGGGFQSLGWIMAVPGASNTILEA